MDYIRIKAERFREICDEFGSLYLWKRVNGE